MLTLLMMLLLLVCRYVQRRGPFFARSWLCGALLFAENCMPSPSCVMCAWIFKCVMHLLGKLWVAASPLLCHAPHSSLCESRLHWFSEKWRKMRNNFPRPVVKTEECIFFFIFPLTFAWFISALGFISVNIYCESSSQHKHTLAWWFGMFGGGFRGKSTTTKKRAIDVSINPVIHLHVSVSPLAIRFLISHRSLYWGATIFRGPIFKIKQKR